MKIFNKLNIFTRILIILFFVFAIFISMLWIDSGKTYLYIGDIKVGNLNLGPYEGKIFFSTLLTFSAAIVFTFYILVEKQRVHPITAFIMANFVIQSASFTFEYLYILLYWQVQLVIQYFFLLNWIFGLILGYAIGFGFGFMKLRKRFIVLFLLFLAVMLFWRLGGYPQLIHKESPAFTAQNYIHLPVEAGYPLNILSKLLITIAVISLLQLSPNKNCFPDKVCRSITSYMGKRFK